MIRGLPHLPLRRRRSGVESSGVQATPRRVSTARRQLVLAFSEAAHERVFPTARCYAVRRCMLLPPVSRHARAVLRRQRRASCRALPSAARSRPPALRRAVGSLSTSRHAQNPAIEFSLPPFSLVSASTPPADYTVSVYNCQSIQAITLVRRFFVIFAPLCYASAVAARCLAHDAEE